MVSVGEGRERLQERGESDVLAGRRRRKEKSRVSLLLVDLLTQRAQLPLGQYIIPVLLNSMQSQHTNLLKGESRLTLLV